MTMFWRRTAKRFWTFSRSLSSRTGRGKRRISYVFVAALALSTFVFVAEIVKRNYYNYEWRQTVLRELEIPSYPVVPDQTCVPPTLDLWHSQMMPFFKKYKAFYCSEEEEWVYVEKGRFQISSTALDRHGPIACSYTPLLRGNGDDDVYQGEVIKNMKHGQLITSDFFHSQCKAADGASLNGFHAGVAYRKGLQDSYIAEPSGDNPMSGMNVLIFGFDSVSHMSWLRNLPRSTEYFVNTLGGVVLDGYNINGDGTPAALLPIFTGKTEQELPEARRSKPNAKPVDDYPWIWKTLEERGYATQWGEDQPGLGAFNYRMLGFKHPPSTHYLRPFYLALENDYWQYSMCVGPKLRHKVMMEWVEQFYDLYPGRPKFSFLFHGEYSHEGTAELQAADDDLLGFLERLHKKEHLNNTILILMSDHGARFSTLRKLPQGKFEERLPFFSVRLPDAFVKRHPQALANLKINARRLTNPFDIHATLQNLLQFKGTGKSSKIHRGISLLNEVPEDRTCEDADIPAHYCTCLKWNDMHVSEPLVKAAAAKLVDVINDMTVEVRSVCAKLQLKEVFSAKRSAPRAELLKFKGAADADGYVPDMSDKMEAVEEAIEIAIEVSPSSGQYEATLKHDISKNLLFVDSREISRINRYGNQPSCVSQKMPHLRPYCYCT